MATYVTPIRPQQTQNTAKRRTRLQTGAGLSSLLTVCVFAIQGYHPYAEDGGLYMASIEKRIDPSLFPFWGDFVTEPSRHSMFARFIAAGAKLTHLSLPVILGLLYISTIWLTLYAAWMLAEQCFEERLHRVGAVCLLAFVLGLPIAGTALVIMDPYLTARSFSTPATIFALVGVLHWTSADLHLQRRGRLLCVGALVAAFLMHPLMAAYALGAALILGSLRSSVPAIQHWGAASIFACALLFAGTLHWTAPREDPRYIQIALTRSYWFLSQWRWYEVIGIIAPLLILAIAAARKRSAPANRPHEQTARRALIQCALWVGTSSAIVALFFARSDAGVHLVARLQPLRAFLIVYLVMTLLLGAAMAKHVLKHSLWRWSAAACLIGGIMFAASRSTFPDLPHIELRESTSRNPWVQSFLWIRGHTPGNALFALDSDYIHAPGEDAQCFRALAQRSALADDSKDGGEASIAPDLTGQWSLAHNAQTNLDKLTDSERLARLAPLGVSWIVLPSQARTAFRCPYSNQAVKVCQLARPD